MTNAISQRSHKRGGRATEPLDYPRKCPHICWGESWLQAGRVFIPRSHRFDYVPGTATCSWHKWSHLMDFCPLCSGHAVLPPVLKDASMFLPSLSTWSPLLQVPASCTSLPRWGLAESAASSSPSNSYCLHLWVLSFLLHLALSAISRSPTSIYLSFINHVSFVVCLSIVYHLSLSLCRWSFAHLASRM